MYDYTCFTPIYWYIFKDVILGASVEKSVKLQANPNTNIKELEDRLNNAGLPNKL